MTCEPLGELVAWVQGYGIQEARLAVMTVVMTHVTVVITHVTTNSDYSNDSHDC